MNVKQNEETSDIYKFLIEQSGGKAPLWNYTKVSKTNKKKKNLKSPLPEFGLCRRTVKKPNSSLQNNFKLLTSKTLNSLLQYIVEKDGTVERYGPQAGALFFSSIIDLISGQSIESHIRKCLRK